MTMTASENTLPSALPLATDCPATGVSDALLRRRSVRAFTDRPVDRVLLADIMATAQRSASGGNLQPWQATIVTGAAWDRVKAAVAERLAMGVMGMQPEYAIYPDGLTAPWEDRRRDVGQRLYAALNIGRGDADGRRAQFAANYTGFGAPVMLYLHCSRIMGPPQWGDMGIWLQSVMLLLAEAGLDSCPQECWAMFGQTVRDSLDIGDDQILWTGLAIGHADTAHPVNNWPVPRVAVDDVITWQGFE